MCNVARIVTLCAYYTLRLSAAFSSARQHLSYDDCVRQEIISSIVQCSVLYCLLKLSTVMSSSYSSLDWVLSHWPHSLCLDSIVFMFVFFFGVILSYCICVVLL